MFHSSRDLCSVKVNRVNNSNNKTKKGEAEIYGCDYCSDGGWTSETEVELHKTKKHFKRSFMNGLRKRDDYCCVCIKQFASKSSILKHIKTEHLLSSETCSRVEREIFVCETCSAIFFNKQNLVIHLRYAHLNTRNIKLVKCVLCLRKIQTRNIPAHFYMHNIQSVSTCRICLHKCLNTRLLSEHLKTHPYYLKCEICGFETAKLDAFQNHVFLSHKYTVKTKTSVPGQAANDKETRNADKKLTTVDKPLMTDDKSFMTADKQLMTADEPLTTDHKQLVTVDSGSDNKILPISFSDDLMEADDDVDLITVIEIIDNDSLDDTDNNLTTDNVNIGEGLIAPDSIKKEIIDTDSITDVINETREIKKEIIDTDLNTDMKTTDVIKKEVTVKEELDIDNDFVMGSVKQETDSTDLMKPSQQTDEKNVIDFKRFFIPRNPSYLRLQRVAGVKGIRLSNDVHICVLCREICVGPEEMRVHVDVHKVIKEKASNTYQCSCGERFSNKVLLKYHAFKSKHVIDK